MLLFSHPAILSNYPHLKSQTLTSPSGCAQVHIPGGTLKHFAITFLLVAIAYPFELNGQTARSSTLEELAVYNGTDREQLLVNGAKKEGKVVWYTAMAGGSYKDLARAFEARYGIPVEAYRGASRDLIAKMLADTQAKKYLMDVVESSAPLLMLMRAMKRLTPFSCRIWRNLLLMPRKRRGKIPYIGRPIGNPIWDSPTTRTNYPLRQCRKITMDC